VKPGEAMNPFDAGDAKLLARAIQRLVANGIEAHQLRVDLVKGLLAAANLAGDKTEAAELRLQLEILARGRQD
jgi:hypothetical protein